MSITETVLEMHFHKPIMDLIRDAFGLGPGGQMNFYKWSPQKECFVGFDQAYVRTQLRDADSRQGLQDILTDVRSLGISEEARIFKRRIHRDIVRLAEESLMIVRVRRE